MAVTVTASKTTGQNTRSWLIEMTADADITSGNIAHGLPFVPTWYTLTPLLDAFYTGRYFISTIDATNVVVTAANAVGSGAAGDALLLTVGRLHSTMV